jgi:type II secretory pathway pseudopilin PulG
MANQAVRGFTIIELMLFLAVTGMLTIGVLMGSGTAIAQQRYKDSVNTLKGFIQEQYNVTTNVVNGNKKNPTCSRSGGSLALDNNAPQNRGTSDCLLLGRYMLIEPTKITVYDVVGRSSIDDSGEDDIAALQNYTLRASTTSEVKEIDWGATLVNPGTGTALTTSVMIIRSPLSGSVLTFVRDGNRNPSVMVERSYLVAKDLCIDPQGGVTASRRLAVRINAGATSQSSIEVPLEGATVCD